MDYIDLNGKWDVELSDGSKWTALLPGTLDENCIGYKDKCHTKLHQDENYIENVSLSNESLIATRFTRKYTYEGEASFSKMFNESIPGGKRLFIEAERARSLRLFIDGCEIEKIRGTLSTPYCFEVTDFLHKGSEIKFISDNSYKGMPHDDILYSSAATDETQTNWNGITGYLRIRTEEKDFVEEIKVFTDKDYKARVKVYVNSQNGYDGSIYIKSDAFRNDININVKTLRGRTEIEIRDIELIEGIKFWDEYKGNLYNVEVRLKSYEDTPAVSGFFGVRYFGDDGHGHFQLNGRRIFLRSEANCAVYPEKGHPDTEVEEWEQIIKTYKAYGVNLLRFHSHCPPDAAFTAADKLGMLMQPELSNWNPKNAFGSDESRNYYEKELFEIINVYGNHPSFVMLTFGNELQADESGMSYMHELLEQCHELDDTRLYAIGSNAFYGDEGCDSDSDFYTAMRYRGLDLRATFDGMKGYLNNDYPGAVRNYDKTMSELRKEYSKPVFSFEVGQYEVLPDFDEIKDFKGVTVPDNYKLIQDKVINKGMSDSWKRRVEATGELSLLCYREEVEAALRTVDFSGISLLGLQDFPGQGTALVGMLNSHLKSKPYSFASPERFSSFFTQVLPL
ncbi:MAG: hypothetical protein K6B41_11440, partial [Butyrivibrio sp.]|nr:hypothetical protein [Butyrivibrio sp.]